LEPGHLPGQAGVGPRLNSQSPGIEREKRKGLQLIDSFDAAETVAMAENIFEVPPSNRFLVPDDAA